MSKKILSVVVALVVVFAMFIPMTASAAVVTPVSDAADFNKVVDGWYTTNNGGFKFDVGSWIYYGMYGLTLVAENSFGIHACTIAIYDADADDVFANKTQADFETVLKETAIVFEKTTIGNTDFPMVYCKTATYENYVFQAHGHKYFINFIYADGYNGDTRDDFTEFAASVMDTIVIADDPEPNYVIYKVDGLEVARDKYWNGDAITPREEPAKDGFEFSGWSEIPATMGEEDIIVEGTFTKLSPTIFEVIYYVDGVEYARESYEVGQEIVAVAAPEKEGFTFSGWSEIPEVMPEEDVTVNGTFTENGPAGNPETGDDTALIAVGAIAVLAFVALVATKKRAFSK